MPLTARACSHPFGFGQKGKNGNRFCEVLCVFVTTASGLLPAKILSAAVADQATTLSSVRVCTSIPGLQHYVRSVVPVNSAPRNPNCLCSSGSFGLCI